MLMISYDSNYVSPAEQVQLGTIRNVDHMVCVRINMMHPELGINLVTL